MCRLRKDVIVQNAVAIHRCDGSLRYKGKGISRSITENGQRPAIFPAIRIPNLYMLVSDAARTFVGGAGILIPLYIFPGDPSSCSAWDPLFTACVSQAHRFRSILICFFYLSACRRSQRCCSPLLSTPRAALVHKAASPVRPIKVASRFFGGTIA